MESQDLIEPNQETKAELLNFLLNEKSKQDKSKSNLLNSFRENILNSKSGFKDLLEKLDSNIKQLETYFSKISQAQKISLFERDPELSLLSLNPEEAIQKIKIMIPSNSFNDIKLICILSGEIEKIIEELIEKKLELFLKNKISTIENEIMESMDSNKYQIDNQLKKLENLEKSVVELRNSIEFDKKNKDEAMNNLKKEVKKQSEQQNELQNKLNELPTAYQAKNSNNYSWYFILSILMLFLCIITLKYSPFFNSKINPGPLIEIPDYPHTPDPLKNPNNPTSNSPPPKTNDSPNNPPPSNLQNNPTIPSPKTNNPLENSKIAAYNSAVEASELITGISNYNRIVTIDLKTFKKKHFEYSHNIQAYGKVFIPNDQSIFVYGYYLFNGNTPIRETFVIDANQKIKQIAPGLQEGYPSLAYFDDYVYAFGDKVSARYSFHQKKWESLAPLPYELPSTYCMGFKGHILIVEYSKSKLISYDIKQNQFKDVPNISLLQYINKNIFSADNRVYIIEFPGYIYRSAENDFTIWETIGTNIIDKGIMSSYTVKFNSKFYFTTRKDSLIEYDYIEGTIKETNIYNLNNQ